MTKDTSAAPLVCWSCGERIFGNTWIWLDGRPWHQSCCTTPATANAAEIATLRADLTACRAALRELVAVADLGADVISYLANDGDPFAQPFIAKRDDMVRRKPLAWSAARAILQSTGEGEGK